MNTFRLVLIAALALAQGTYAQSAEETSDMPPNYAQNADARERIYQLAETHQIDARYLLSLLIAIHRDEDVLAKISRPAEKSKPWFEYATIFSDAARLEDGVAFYRQHREALERAYAQYGVDPAVITAIIGVETRYGKVTGNTPVLQALATLCFDYPPRAEFFCSEFDHFLLLAQQEDWNPLQIQGSYAGAMGMAQFMPSSYRNDAIDFDGDGKINLWQSPEDAIGSIANYLANRGWQKDGDLYYQLPQKPSLSIFDGNVKPAYALQDLSTDESLKSDQNFMNWLASQSAETVGSLVLQGEQEELAFIIYNNFYVITRYNTSPMYAMAVSNLAAAIKESN